MEATVVVGLLILRIVLGAVLIPHGMQKLFGSFGGGGVRGTGATFGQMGLRPGPGMALLSGLIEFFGGLLIIVGFLTPIAAFLVLLNMIVAILTAHLRNGFFNSNGGYEFPLLVAGAALALLSSGAGSISIDAAFSIFWL